MRKQYQIEKLSAEGWTTDGLYVGGISDLLECERVTRKYAANDDSWCGTYRFVNMATGRVVRKFKVAVQS